MVDFIYVVMLEKFLGIGYFFFEKFFGYCIVFICVLIKSLGIFFWEGENFGDGFLIL